MTLVKDDKADFIQGKLVQWGFVVGQRNRTQLQQGQLGIYNQGARRQSLGGKLLRDTEDSCWTDSTEFLMMTGQDSKMSRVGNENLIR